ncbi:MAG: UMP kinase [Desulfomonilaceae bacterium]
MGSSGGYRRALLKISGEAFAGDRGYGWDIVKIRWIAEQIAQAHRDRREIGIVVGGGNILRGSDAVSIGVPVLVADQMGMIATVLNAMALRSALEIARVRAYVMCAFPVGNYVQAFDMEKAVDYLQRGNIVIFAGGTGNPCFTTDSAAALRAVEINADIMVKATQVRGVFDKDPKKNPDASFFEKISPEEVLQKRLGVIDAASIEILGRKKIPVIVLSLHEDANIFRALSGEKIGTVIA